MSKYDEVLDEVILEELEALQSMEVGSEEYKTTVEGVAKLLDKVNESKKLDIEGEQKAKSMREERLHRIVQSALSALSIFGGFVLHVWGTNKTLRFEETGTITSTPGRKIVGNLFLKR